MFFSECVSPLRTWDRGCEVSRANVGDSFSPARVGESNSTFIWNHFHSL